MYFNIYYCNLLLVFHCVVANFLALLIILHMIKSLLFSNKNLLLVKLVGCGIFGCFCLICFTGYLLPFGQMSFWGGVVILSLLSVLPFYDYFINQIFADFSFSFVTLKRMYVLHFIIPFLTLILVIVHLELLHVFQSSFDQNQSSYSSLSFYPNILLVDFHVLLVWFTLIFYVISFFPFSMYESTNFNKYNSMVTPLHIVPEWYFIFFYGVLKAYSVKLSGVIFFLISIACTLISIFSRNDFIFMKSRSVLLSR